MKIIIVEDVESKADKLRDIVNLSVTGAEVIRARSYHSGVSEIQKKAVLNLLLVDMSIPVFDEDSISDPDALSLGGKNLIEHLSCLGIKPKTIIVSGYERFPFDTGDLDLADIYYALRENHGSHVMGYVKYAEGNLDANDQVRRLIMTALS